jgi:hypothetical protein
VGQLDAALLRHDQHDDNLVPLPLCAKRASDDRAVERATLADASHMQTDAARARTVSRVLTDSAAP